MGLALGLNPVEYASWCTPSVYRLAKEKAMYEKEVVDQEAKIEKMKADEKDAYDIKKQARSLK